MSKYSENMPPDLKDAIGWMLEYIEDGKTLLDFGCSTGYFGSFIKKAKNNKVYGIEISKDVEEARKVLDGVYTFDIDADWPEEIYERKYDYLFFGDIIEHLKDPAGALKNARKLLNKGGLVFISTPNVAHISVRLELMGGNFEYEPMGILDNTHLKYFTRKSLTRLVEDAGYTLKSIDFSANDYPDSIVRKLLAKAGLKPTERFWAMANQPEARAFQYKLVLQPGSSKAGAGFKTPSQKPESIRNAAMDDLEQKARNLEKHAREQAKIIEHYKHKSEELERRLSSIESSGAYRAAKKAAKVIRRR